MLDWTPVNEPLTTARFSTLYGIWYPHARDERLFWLALTFVGRLATYRFYNMDLIVGQALATYRRKFKDNTVSRQE